MQSNQSDPDRGQLWRMLKERTQSAIACGELHSIDTRTTWIEQNGIRFLLRVASSLRRKAHDKQLRANQARNANKEFNPFLPPEEALTVTVLNDDYLAVLNKFNVVPHHLLIVTRAFKHQEILLSLEDFQALWQCLAQYPALGFYNGGATAGASQKHKHLQLVPLPMQEIGPPLPIDTVLPLTPPGEIAFVAALPFEHYFARLPDGISSHPIEAARLSYAIFQTMLAKAGIHGITRNGETRQSGAYNLLVHKDWLLLVPRSAEFVEGVSLNSLAYVGSLFVANDDQLELITERGPMHFLSGAGKPLRPVP